MTPPDNTHDITDAIDILLDMSALIVPCNNVLSQQLHHPDTVWVCNDSNNEIKCLKMKHC